MIILLGTPETALVSDPLPLMSGNQYVEYDSVELSYGEDIQVFCK